MPSDLYSTQRVSDDYITVNNCGQQMLNSHEYDTVRDKGRVDFGIQFIEDGKCLVEDNGILRTAESGYVLLHFPGVRQHYSFKKEDNTHLMWVHFTGDGCSKLLEPIKSDETVLVKITEFKNFKRTFDRMIACYNIRKPFFKEECCGYLLTLLSIILRNVTAQEKINQNHIHERLDKVINYMNEYFDLPIDLSKYADMCYVSKSRFLHMFKEYTGYSPYRFHLKIRIERAIEMLIYTSLSVEEVATVVGFKDCSYFCRVFKKYTGRNPLYYRK